METVDHGGRMESALVSALVVATCCDRHRSEVDGAEVALMPLILGKSGMLSLFVALFI